MELGGAREIQAKTAWIAAGEFTAAAVGFATSILSAAFLGLEEFGVFGVSMALVATFGALLALPVDDVAARRFQQARREDEDAYPIWSLYYWAVLAFGLARLGILLAALPLFGLLYSSRISAPTALLIVGVTFSAGDSVIVGLFNVQGRAPVIGASRAIGPLLRLGLVALLRPESSVALALIHLTGSAVGSGFVLTAGLAALRRPPTFQLLVVEFRRSRAIVSSLFLASSLRGLANNIDQLLVGRLLGFDATGVYRLGRSIAAAPTVLISVLRFVNGPQIREDAIAGNLSSLRRTLWTLSSWSLISSVAALVGWVLLGRVFVSAVFGEGSADVYLMGGLLILATALENVTTWSKILPAALNNGRLALLDATWYAVAPIPFIIVGIKLLDLPGVAYAMMFVSGFASAAWFWIVARILQRQWMPDGPAS